MGLLFSLFCLFYLGALAGLGAFVPRLRKGALPCAAALMMGSTSSCVLAWDPAIGSEATFSTDAGNVAFWVGFKSLSDAAPFRADQRLTTRRLIVEVRQLANCSAWRCPSTHDLRAPTRSGR
jgi:hypothetical protein